MAPRGSLRSCSSIAGTGPNPGGPEDGDPVDLGSGLLVLSHTDLSLPGPLPIDVSRTYRQNDSVSRAFGRGTNWNFGIFLWSANQYQEADLIMPDGGRVHYLRVSAGTSWTDAVFETTATPTQFYKSQIAWNGDGWDLRLRDGTTWIFGDNAPLAAIRDRFGNTIKLIRANGDANGVITTVVGPGGRWFKLAWDASNRITSATDNTGRIVGYTYDANGYLWKVTDPRGGVTEYTYDASGRMLTAKDARLITFLTNEYYADGKVKKQTQADATTFQFASRSRARRGHWRSVPGRASRSAGLLPSERPRRTTG